MWYKRNDIIFTSKMSQCLSSRVFANIYRFAIFHIILWVTLSNVCACVLKDANMNPNKERCQIKFMGREQRRGDWWPGHVVVQQRKRKHSWFIVAQGKKDFSPFSIARFGHRTCLTGSSTFIFLAACISNYFHVSHECFGIWLQTFKTYAVEGAIFLPFLL